MFLEFVFGKCNIHLIYSYLNLPYGSKVNYSLNLQVCEPVT